MDPACIAPLLACRLIALTKNPGVRPIGIGDTARGIMAKAILSVTKQDLQEAAGPMQLCAEAVLLVDASNALNRHGPPPQYPKTLPCSPH